MLYHTTGTKPPSCKLIVNHIIYTVQVIHKKKKKILVGIQCNFMNVKDLDAINQMVPDPKIASLTGKL